MAIIKTTEHDLLYLDISEGNYYACEDSENIYYDSASDRSLQDVEMLFTENARLYSTIPVEGKRYYVWETNELWIYRNGWKVLVGGSKPADGYVPMPTDNGYRLENVDGVSADSNGILGDGSVCVRDENRIIKGKIYIDKDTNNLVFSSFLGGGLAFYPNGSANTKGALLINPHMQLVGVKVYSYADHAYKEVDLETYLANRDSYDDSTLYLVYKKYDRLNDGYAVYNGEFNTTDDMYVHIEQTEQDAVQVVVTKTSETVEIDEHNSQYITAYDFTYTGIALTEDLAKTLSRLSAYDALGNDITDEVEIVGGEVETDGQWEPVTEILDAINEAEEGQFKITFAIQNTATKKCKVFHEGNLTSESLDEIGVLDQILANAVTVESNSTNIKQLKLGNSTIYPIVTSAGLRGSIQETALDISQDSTINGDWNRAVNNGVYTNTAPATNSPNGTETGTLVVVYRYGNTAIQEAIYPNDTQNKIRKGTYTDEWSWDLWKFGNSATEIEGLRTRVSVLEQTISELTDRIVSLEETAAQLDETYQKKIGSGETLPTTGMEEGDVFIQINSGGA